MPDMTDERRRRVQPSRPTRREVRPLGRPRMWLVAMLGASGLFACGTDESRTADGRAASTSTGGEVASSGGETSGENGGGGPGGGGDGGGGMGGIGGEAPSGAGGAGGGEGGAGGGHGGAGGAAEGGGGAGASACGDGVLDGDEQCDDGNVAADDGCSSTCGVELVLDQGHLDLFEVTYDVAVEAPVLRVKDTTGLYALTTSYREPEEVTVNVDAALAAIEVPPDLPPEYDFLGPAGTPVFLLDITQQEGLPWAGWSTERLLETLPAPIEVADPLEAVTLAVEVDGPGDVFLFSQDSFGLPFPMFVDTADPDPDAIPVGASTHVHATWAFTAAGDYHLSVTPVLHTNTGPVTGPASLFRFRVGELLVTPPGMVSVSMSGGAPMTFAVGDEVELQASEEPDVESPVYDWYRFADEYELLPAEHADALEFQATRVGWSIYSAALLSPENGRILGVGSAEVTVE